MNESNDAWTGKDFWSDEKRLKLIRILQKNPKLLIKHPTIEREALWKKVADVIGFNVEVVKLQKTFLCKQFFNQYKIAKCHPHYKSTWKYYEPLKFLADIGTFIQNNKRDTENTTSDIQTEASNRVLGPHIKVSIAKHWNCDNTIKFLDLIQKHKVIWDDSNATCMETTTKQQNAWEDISKEINLPVSALKEKFKSLCSTYYTLHKEIAKDPTYVVGWIYFAHMEFLPLPPNVLNAIEFIQTKMQSKEKLALATNKRQKEATNFAKKSTAKSTSRKRRNSNLAENTSEACEMEHVEIADKNSKETVQETEISSTSNLNDCDNEDVEMSDFAFSEHKQYTNNTNMTKNHVELQKANGNTNSKRRSNRMCDEYEIFGQVVANEMRKMQKFKQIQKTFRRKVDQALIRARNAAKNQK